MGFFNDPIELHPFDNCFKESKIIKMWIAVVILLMIGNAANDPKGGYELEEGGPPKVLLMIILELLRSE